MMLLIDIVNDLWICFAMKRDGKELILDYEGSNLELRKYYPVPQFLFNNSSLVKMKLCACYFDTYGEVNWESLRSLFLNQCMLDDQEIQNVICGSPLLECLELIYYGFEGDLVISSKNLKTFVVEEIGWKRDLIEISCPNL